MADDKSKWPEVGLYACRHCGTVRVHTTISQRVPPPKSFDGYCFACGNSEIFEAITIDFAAHKFLLVQI